MITVIHVYNVFDVLFFLFFFFGSIFYAWIHAYLWCFSVLFKIVRPISGESSTKLPIWGHHTQIHRFYGIKRWNTMRKKKKNVVTPIPPCSQWPSDSGKLYVTTNKWIFHFTKDLFFCPKKPLGVHPYYNIRSPLKPERMVWTFRGGTHGSQCKAFTSFCSSSMFFVIGFV